MTVIKAVSFNFCQGHFLSNEVVALKGALEKDAAMKVGWNSYHIPHIFKRYLGSIFVTSKRKVGVKRKEKGCDGYILVCRFFCLKQ